MDDIEVPWWATQPFHMLFGTHEALPAYISTEAIHSVVKKHGYGNLQADDNAVSLWTDRNGKQLARVRFTGVNQNSAHFKRNLKIVEAARAGKAIVHSYKRRRRGEDDTTLELVGYIDRRVSQLDPPEAVLIRNQSDPAGTGASV